MEKYATLNLRHSSLQGLTRTSSFSELPTTNRRFIFQESDSTGGLVKQYSYEQIFIKDSNNIKKIQHSTIITTEKKLSGLDIWKKNIPRYHSASNIAWPPRNSSQDLSMINIKKEKTDDTPESLDLSALNGLKISDHESFKEGIVKPEKVILTAVVSPNNANRITENDNHSLLSEQSVKRLSAVSARKSIENQKFPKLFQEDKESKSSVQKLDIQNTAIDGSEIKKNIRSLVRQKKTEMSNNSNKRWFKAGLVVIVGLIATMLTSLSSNTKAMTFDFTNTSLELQKNIFGQDEAIETLSDHFYQNNNNFTVVVFVGGTGVGKSYSKEIIKKHFPYSYNIFEYTPPLEKFVIPAYDALSSLQCNLVILENLKFTDLQDFMKFTKFFYNQKERPCVIILTIINPEVINDDLVRSVDTNQSIKEVEKLFFEENIPVKTIGFKCLSLEDINACIEKETRKSNIKLTSQQFEEVRKSLVTANSGCKGAYAKVQLYANFPQ